MSEHPFNFDYIGLGLLDEGSIQRHRESWAAEYRAAAGDPYLVIYVGPRRVRIEEFDAGKRVAATVAPKLTQAIAMHGGDALGGDHSRFWERVSASTPSARVQTACPNVRFSFVPAMGIGQLCLPLPADVAWHAPAPGPIARRIGLAAFNRTAEIGYATLRRLVNGAWSQELERIQLVKAEIPGILVAETVRSCLDAYGPTRSAEWRPFVRSEPSSRVSQLWQPRGRPLSEGEPGLEAFSIVEDAPAAIATAGMSAEPI